jgi:hypothetical protein
MGNRAWFEGARLGLFVHGDHASQQGLEVSGAPGEPRASGQPRASGERG